MAKGRKTSAKAAKAASKVLRDGRTGKASKAAAGSALSQRAPKKKANRLSEESASIAWDCQERLRSREVTMAGNVKFGLKIKHLREAKKVTDPAFSLRRFAEAVGLSPTFISKIENGEFDPPRPEKIKKMAELLGTDPDELLELAGRADPDLVEQVKKPQVADFLRTVTQNLNEEDIRKLTEEIRAKKKKDAGDDK